MFKAIARLLLFRVLPRRLLPWLAAWEIFRTVTAGRRRRRDAASAETVQPDSRTTVVRPRVRTSAGRGTRMG